MRHIIVMNPKGGCGKSTIATNLASGYAARGQAVALADFDTQRSSLDWAESRPEEAPPVTGVAAFDDGLRAVPRNADVVVIDAPARVHGRELTELVRRAETILVPVLPSEIDMRAAAQFIDEILEVGKVAREQAKIAVVANRINVRAYARGLGIFELPEYLAWPDWEQWGPLMDWLGSSASRP